MITPSFGLTSTERVLPRLALDFTSAIMDPRVTITRAANTATCTTASNAVEIVAQNLPRFDYLNGVCVGLLIEETRSNFLLNSVFDGAVAGTPGTPPTNWTNLTSTGTISSVSPGIYALGNAIRITTSSTRRSFYKAYSLSANTTYAYSIKITVNSTPNVNFPRIQDCMNLINGPAGSTVTYLLNNAAATGTTVLPNGQTSTVVAIIAVAATAGTVEVRWGLGVNSTVDGDVTIQMPQLEAGAFPTSYIPTTTTSLTRNADAVSMTGTNFSSWYSSSSAALAAVVIPNIATGTRPIWQLDDTTANEIIALRGNVANPELYIVDNGTPQAQLDAGTITANTQYGLCAAFTANSCAASQNGAAPVTTATATMPTVTQARIGSDGSNFLNGVVRTLRYWPQRILNAETQAFSK